VRLNRRVAVWLGCVALMGGLVAGCGDDEDEGGGAPQAEETGTTEGAKVIDVNAMENASGEVTLCMGKDTGGDVTEAVKQFNAQDNGVTVKLLEFSTSADEQRASFVQRQEAKSGECDVFSSDVIWTAEFASQKWLYDLTPYVETREAEVIPATLETVNYDGKFWGMPQQTDAAFIYYRTDQVKEEPATWQEVYQLAADNDGIVYQGAPYEGLTCDFLELAFAAGGQVLNEAGTEAVIDSPENVEALQFMVEGVENGTAARGVTTYMEEESRRYFESGKATFMRNWPYAYALGQKAPAVKGKFDVMPFPEWEGGTTAGILGGHNQVVSVFSENPGGALKWIDYITGEENQKRQILLASQSPVLKAIYDDPAVQKKYEFATQLRDAISQAKARPVSPVYPQISQAIYKNVNEALAGRTSPEEALKTAQSEMQSALETF
jgi:multiple sugar transport system substrate-binding protein